jgi:hypothetical protein
MATVVYNAKKMELCHRDYDTLAMKKGEKNFTNPRGYGPPWRQTDQLQGSPV